MLGTKLLGVGIVLCITLALFIMTSEIVEYANDTKGPPRVRVVQMENDDFVVQYSKPDDGKSGWTSYSGRYNHKKEACLFAKRMREELIEEYNKDVVRETVECCE